MEYDNTRRDQIDICNLPLLYTIAPKSTLQRSFNIDKHRVGIKKKSRQRQCFENSQKYLGAREGFS